MDHDLFSGIHKKVLEDKKKGKPIRHTIKSLGISKAYYYKLLDKYNENKWTRTRFEAIRREVKPDNPDPQKKTNAKLNKGVIKKKETGPKMKGGGLEDKMDTPQDQEEFIKETRAFFERHKRRQLKKDGSKI